MSNYNSYDVEMDNATTEGTHLFKDTTTPSSDQGTCGRLKPLLLVSLAAAAASGIYFLGRHSVSPNEVEESPVDLMQEYQEYRDGKYDNDYPKTTANPWDTFPANNLAPSDYNLDFHVKYPSQRETNNAAQNALAAINKRLAQIQGMDQLSVLSDAGLFTYRQTGTFAPSTSPLFQFDDDYYLWTAIKNQYARYILWQMVDTYILHVVGSVTNQALGVVIRKCDPSTGSILELGVISTLICELFPRLCQTPPTEAPTYAPTSPPSYPTSSTPDLTSPSEPVLDDGPDLSLGDLVDLAIELYGEQLCEDFKYTCIMCTSGCLDSDWGDYIFARDSGRPDEYCNEFCEDYPYARYRPSRRALAKKVSKDGKDDYDYYGKDSKPSYDNEYDASYPDHHYRKDAKDGHDDTIKFRSSSNVQIDASDAFTCLTDGINDHMNRVANEEFSTTHLGTDGLCQPQAMIVDWSLDPYYNHMAGYGMLGAVLATAVPPKGGISDNDFTGVFPTYMCVKPVNGFLSLSGPAVNALNIVFYGDFDECLGAPNSPYYDYSNACPNWHEYGNGQALVDGAIATVSCAVETNLMLKQIKGCSTLPTDPDFNLFPGLLRLIADQRIEEILDQLDSLPFGSAPGIQSQEIPLSELQKTVSTIVGLRLNAKLNKQ